MKFKLNAQRWFWILIFACAVWGWLGVRTTPKSAVWTSASFMARTQNLASKPFQLVMTPLQIVPTFVQTGFQSAVQKLMRPSVPGSSAEELRNHIRVLENQLLYQTGRNDLLQEQITAYRIIVNRGIDPRFVVQATITGYQSGIATNTVSLDKGSMDGIKGPAPALSEQSLIGRISSIGPKTSTLRLLTDPRVKVQASIVRLTPNGLVTIVPTCLVSGLGGGRMICDTVQVTSAPVKPEAGDLVRLNDPEWPASIRNTVLGEVTDVSRKESRFLLYDIRIVPRVNINSISTALIVLGD